MNGAVNTYGAFKGLPKMTKQTSLAAPRKSMGSAEAGTPPAGQRGLGGTAPRKPQYININQTEDAANNILAQGYQQADRRYQLKQLDRAGISRGKGHEYIAGQEGAAAMAGAANQAAGIRMEDQAKNSEMRSEYERNREDAALTDQMADHTKSETDWATLFARKQAQYQLNQAQAAVNLQMRMNLLAGM